MPSQLRTKEGTARGFQGNERLGALRLPARRSDLLPAHSLFLDSFTHF